MLKDQASKIRGWSCGMLEKTCHPCDFHADRMDLLRCSFFAVYRPVVCNTPAKKSRIRSLAEFPGNLKRHFNSCFFGAWLSRCLFRWFRHVIPKESAMQFRRMSPPCSGSCRHPLGRSEATLVF